MEGKTKTKQKNKVPFRLNILFIIVFLLFSMLILKLGLVQIVHGQSYQKKEQSNHKKTSQLQAARGLIYDSTGKLLVGNKPARAITFTRKNNETSQDLLKLAKKLSNYITLNTSKLTKTDFKNYWVIKQGLANAYKEKLSKSEYQKVLKSNNSNTGYKMLLNRVTKKNLASVEDKHDEQIAAIYFKLNQAMNLTPSYVKIGISNKTFDQIGGHLAQLPGINLTMASSREHPNGDPFYLGSVGQIPRGKLNYYHVRGYQNNELVGTSGLEQYYESELHGTPSKLVYQTNKSNNAIGQPKKIQGHRGDSLVLTINDKFQKKVKKILEQEFLTAKHAGHNPHLHSAYAVVVNPNTGGIIAMDGIKYHNGSFTDAAVNTVQGSFAPGSTVKGGTELAGYHTGTIPSYVDDKPFMGRINFSSYPGNTIKGVTPDTALEVSSNVFMGRIACNLAGIKVQNIGSGDIGSYKATYIPPPKSPRVIKAFRTLRNVYSQLGLGDKTGIDLPSEGIGYKGPIPANATGEILRFAIGQYDTYTPIQIAQYMATIANGGYRMQLHLMKSIRTPSVNSNKPGSILYQYKPKVLDHISMKQKYLNDIHKGFWLVTHGNYLPTAPDLGQAPYAKYRIAGKTGTADVNLKNGGSTVNELFSGYSPAKSSEKPQIAFTVIFPGLDNHGTPGHEFHTEAAGKIVKAYYQITGKKVK